MADTAPARTPLFSVTLKDCRVDTFMVSGAGGQHRDRTSSGVRIVHEPSGAKGEATDSRSQLANKKDAFRKLVANPRFQFWILEERRLEGHQSAEDYAAGEVADPKKIRIEIKDADGRWAEVAFDDQLDATTRDKTKK
jgi:protein subunit release factor A